jgi:hypothetical protein
MQTYTKIYLPTNPQVDTCVAIFLLRTFGVKRYPGIDDSKVEILSAVPEGETTDSFEAQGVLLVDVGGGRFDHHTHGGTATSLVAKDLEVSENPALIKLLQYAERDDVYGKGTISNDPLDRAFGLSGLISALKRTLPDDSDKVVSYVLPLLWGHYMEEVQRTEELPKEFKEKELRGLARRFSVKHKKGNVQVVVLESDNPSMPGWLRSSSGGVKADVVVQRTSIGHTNIVTRQIKRIDLRLVSAYIRREEAMMQGRDIGGVSLPQLMQSGTLKEAPEWYYDRATNSFLNGSVNPQGVDPTVLSLDVIAELVKRGLSELVVGKRNKDVIEKR